MLAPSEMAFVECLEKEKVSISSTKMKESKLVECVHKLQALLSHSADVRYLAERAFVSYLRAVKFMANKEVFKIDELPIADFAASLGLAQAPAMDLQEDIGNTKKNMTKLERLKEKIKLKKEKRKQELAK